MRVNPCKRTCAYKVIIGVKKRVLNVFYFWNVSLFSSGELFYTIKPAKILLNQLNSCIKRLLSDRFNMAAIKGLS